jgi:hypothetical protein
MVDRGAGGAPPRVALTLDGITIRSACEAGAGGETKLVIAGELTAPGSFVGSAVIDGGNTPLGGPGAADGQFSRALATVLFATPTRTVRVTVAAVVDGVADRRTLDGLAVPSG